MELTYDQWLALNAALDELRNVIEGDEDPRLLRAYARLGLALSGSRPDGDDVLAAAITTFKRLLARMDRSDPREWARTQLDFGDAWREFSTYPFARDVSKEGAIAAYAAAAATMTPETDVDLWARAELKLALATWLATDWSSRDESSQQIGARLEHVIKVIAEQRPYDFDGVTRRALKLIREMLTSISESELRFSNADVTRCREAFDRELACAGKHKDSVAPLRDWADLMNDKAAYMSTAAERRNDLWLLTESDKVIADALTMIDGQAEQTRAALWESWHYLRRAQQRNQDLRSRMR